MMELGRFPSSGELRLKASNCKDFPSHTTFDRWGGRDGKARVVRAYCESNGLDVLLQYCPLVKEPTRLEPNNGDKTEKNLTLGVVYMYKMGTSYKIGKTNNLKRRDREIILQLPEEAELIHRINTDDIDGIEKYWHQRFAGRRLNGEWFKLSATDVKAFCRRKFM